MIETLHTVAAIKAEQCVASDDPRRPRMVAKLRPRPGEKLRLAKGWYFLLPPFNDNFQIMRGAPLARWKNPNTHPYSSVEGCEQFRHLAAAVQANLVAQGSPWSGGETLREMTALAQCVSADDPRLAEYHYLAE